MIVKVKTFAGLREILKGKDKIGVGAKSYHQRPYLSLFSWSKNYNIILDELGEYKVFLIFPIYIPIC